MLAFLRSRFCFLDPPPSITLPSSFAVMIGCFFGLVSLLICSRFAVDSTLRQSIPNRYPIDTQSIPDHHPNQTARWDQGWVIRRGKVGHDLSDFLRSEGGRLQRNRGTFSTIKKGLEQAVEPNIHRLSPAFLSKARRVFTS